MEEIFFFIPTLQQWRRSCKRVGLVLCIYMYFILFIYLFFFEHCLLSPLFIHLLWCCLYLRVNTWMNAASITFSRLVWFSRGCGSLMRSGCFWDTFGMFWDLWVCWSAWDAPKWPVFIDVGVSIFHRWMAAINPPFPYRALGVEPPSSSPPLPLLLHSSSSSSSSSSSAGVTGPHSLDIIRQSQTFALGEGLIQSNWLP